MRGGTIRRLVAPVQVVSPSLRCRCMCITTEANQDQNQAHLQGIKVVELGGLAPVPFAGMMMADWGADVIRVDKLDKSMYPDTLCRGKRSIALDLKHERGRETLLELLRHADVVLDPFRPTVLENLNLSPKTMFEVNEQLVIARLTGYGQTGQKSSKVGHDINYLADSGVLHLCRTNETEAPVPPVNLLGDFAAGGLLCVASVMMSLFKRTRTNKGEVIDCSMSDGLVYLSSIIHGLRQSGWWQDALGVNLLDGGAPFYNIYQTEDEKFLAVGAIEPPFFKAFLEGLNVDLVERKNQMDPAQWPRLRTRFQEIISSQELKHWLLVFEGTDACVSPVLSITDVLQDQHIKDRQLLTYDDDGRKYHILSVPKFSDASGSETKLSPVTELLQFHLENGSHTDEILTEWCGMDPQSVQELKEARAAH